MGVSPHAWALLGSGGAGRRVGTHGPSTCRSSRGGHEDAARGEGVSAHEGEELREAEQGQHFPPRSSCEGLWRGADGSRLGGFTDSGRFLTRLESSRVFGGREGCWEAAPALNPARAGGGQPRRRLPAVLSPQDVLELAFSIVYDMEEYCLNFVAPTRYEVSSQGLLQPMSLPRGQQVGKRLVCVCVCP